ncbi:unnamed protein product [Lampetra planeri]
MHKPCTRPSGRLITFGTASSDWNENKARENTSRKHLRGTAVDASEGPMPAKLGPVRSSGDDLRKCSQHTTPRCSARERLRINSTSRGHAAPPTSAKSFQQQQQPPSIFAFRKTSLN